MRVKDAVSNIQKTHPEEQLIPLYTPWGESIKNTGTDTVWQEYPRPQLERTNYRILNGRWRCWFTPVPEDADTVSDDAASEGSIVSEGDVTAGQQYTGEKRDILVPFSPESLLSGVGQQLQPEEYLWYEKEVSFSEEDLARKAKGQRCLLHFDAVDQQAAVYCNGQEVVSHTGGYLPFHSDVTEYVSGTPLQLRVRVRDSSDTSWHARGKQALDRGGMFYTAQSGIWQSVWYEWVPKNHIERMEITPDADQGAVSVKLFSTQEFSSVSCTVYQATDQFVSFNDASTDTLPGKRTRALIGVSVQRESSAPNILRIILPKDDISLWTPKNPYLYSFTILADNDTVHGYFALRSFTVEPDEKGILRFCLNHKPYFLHGLLDQGYWPDGLMTAPCDKALIYDIDLAKKSGFNMLRKHIKIEALRWYYHCDRLGMIVWQDMVNGGTSYHMPLVCYLPTVFPRIFRHARDSHYKLFSRRETAGRTAWEQECMETVKHLYSAPSVAVWVPFNEGWGQFDAARIAMLIKEKDPTRPVDHASGWFDQRGGDFKSVHNYFRKLKAKPDKKRAFVISEYGGYACHMEGHSSAAQIFGYRQYATIEELNTAYRQLLEKQLMPLIEKGLSGAVYTQLSDVEEEVNGLVTYDRKVIKLDALPTDTFTYSPASFPELSSHENTPE